MLIRGLIPLLALTVSTVPSTAGDGDGVADPTIDLIAEGDTIGAGIIVPDVVRPGEPGSVNGDCRWRFYLYSIEPPEPGDEFSQRPFIRQHPVTDRLQVAVDYVCDDTVVGIGWVDADPPPTAELIAGPRAEVRRRLPEPVPIVNPSGGATVNLGLWLAVRPPTPVTATASVLGHRASVTATHVATLFNMGDGTVVRCSGAGSEFDLGASGRVGIEAGPCGHTYQRPTPEGQPYRVEVTMEWATTYVTGAARGTLPTLTTSTWIDIPVAEVQSIGVG